MLDTKDAVRLAGYVERHIGTITNALHNHADHMRDAATQARAAYEAGQADPAVRAAQDASIMSNNGLRHAAAMFTEDADKARKVATELQDLVDAGDDTEDRDTEDRA